jgi:hypothetical protein
VSIETQECLGVEVYMKETRDETDLKHEYVVVEVADVKQYLGKDEQNTFWMLFWYIKDRKEAVKDGWSLVKEEK